MIQSVSINRLQFKGKISQPKISTMLGIAQANQPQRITDKTFGKYLPHYYGIRFGHNSILSADTIFNDLKTQSIQHFEETKSVMSLKEFITLVMQDPYKYLPTASDYTLRALEAYGTQEQNVLGEKLPVYNFVNQPWLPEMMKDKTGVIGKEKTISQIVEALKGFRRNGRANRVILLMGPKGSGKSVLFRSIFDALENHSKTPAGVRYSHIWIFGGTTGSALGEVIPHMSAEEYQAKLKKLNTQATQDMLPLDEVKIQLPSNLNMNPLFILPVEMRAKMLKTLLAQGKIKAEDNFDYFLRGSLDDYSKNIYNALLRRYKGDTNKVFQHIKVERWEMSRQSSKGLVEVPPSSNRDAYLKQQTPNIDWSKLPAELRSIGLMEERGNLADANGGLLNFDDMGRELDPSRYLYLLGTGETGEIIMEALGNKGSSTIREQLDTLILGSINPAGIMAMVKSGQWEALNDRFIVIADPFERRYKKEKDLYQKFVTQIQDKGHTMSHDALDAFALWITMTRLFPVMAQHEKSATGHQPYIDTGDADFCSALPKLDPLRKALLYEGEDINSYQINTPLFTQTQEERLKAHLGLISNEHNYNAGKNQIHFYEGSIGIDAREGENILKNLVSLSDKHHNITLLDVLDLLHAQTKTKLPYFTEIQETAKKYNGFKVLEGVNLASREPSAFYGPEMLLGMVEDHMRRRMQYEIKSALGVYREPIYYIQLMNQYIAHVTAFNENATIADRTLRSPLSTNEHPDPVLMKEKESIITNKALSTATEEQEYRAKIGSRLSKWNPNLNENDNIATIFKPELDKLRAKDEENAKDEMKDIIDYWAHPKAFEQDLVKQKNIPKLKKALERLKSMGYEEESIPQILDWALSAKHIADGTYQRKRS